MNHLYHKSLLATSTSTAGTGLWWLLATVRQYGPGWAMVPPLLCSTAALVGAYCSWFRLREDNRRAEEVHRLTVSRLRAGLDGPETLPGRN
jgi:apolipoprotein N-acyltransferase